MPRSNRPKPRRSRGSVRPPEGPEEEGDDLAARALRGFERREAKADGEWMVRRVSGASSSKTYKCPHCGQDIAPGTPHVVAWRVDAPGSWLVDGGDVGTRRHWHSGCWARHA